MKRQHFFGVESLAYVPYLGYLSHVQNLQA
jgi:hypothetical protein